LHVECLWGQLCVRGHACQAGTGGDRCGNVGGDKFLATLIDATLTDWEYVRLFCGMACASECACAAEVYACVCALVCEAGDGVPSLCVSAGRCVMLPVVRLLQLRRSSTSVSTCSSSGRAWHVPRHSCRHSLLSALKPLPPSVFPTADDAGAGVAELRGWGLLPHGPRR
jgi:hypothetical protein